MKNIIDMMKEVCIDDAAELHAVNASDANKILTDDLMGRMMSRIWNIQEEMLADAIRDYRIKARGKTDECRKQKERE